MKHLRNFRLFEQLDYDSVIDAKGDIADTLTQLISFDNEYIKISNEDLEKLVLNDFDTFLELADYYIALHNKYLEERTTQKGPVEITKFLSNFFENIKNIAVTLLDAGKFEDFFVLVSHLKNYKTRFSNYKLLTYSTMEPYLDDQQLITLIKTNVVSYDVVEITKKFRGNSININDLIDHKANLNSYLRGLWNYHPEKLLFDPKLLNQLSKKDFEVLLQFINAIALLNNVIKLYERVENIEKDVKTHLKAVFERTKLWGAFRKNKNIGPYIYRTFYSLFKENRIDDAYRLLDKCRGANFYFMIPFGPKDIETVIPKDVIRKLLVMKAINLSKADTARILDEKDQYAIWISVPSYKILIDDYNASDITSKLIKNNGNLKFDTYYGRDAFTCYSYGVVRRSGATGATIDINQPADNEAGAELLLKSFRAYLSRKAFQALKKDSDSEFVLKYLKDTPIKSRTATAEEWETWFLGLHEYFRFWNKQATSIIKYAGGPVQKLNT